MMGKTHITVGIAASLAVCQPKTVGECCAAVLGGATGGILCDIECHSSKECRDALYARLIVLAMFVILLPLDYFMELGICKEIMAQDQIFLIIGAVVLLFTCFKGRRSPHRTFTHSILYVILFSLGIYFISPMLGIPAAVGGLSHLLIDVFNKKPIQWLYPFKSKICLNLCYASKTANSVLMWVGLGADILLAGFFLVNSMQPLIA